MKKIVIIGPESTGKSSLCQALAAHFNCPWVPEYAREFLKKNGMDYNFGDLLTIARGQIASEDEKAAIYSDAPYLFVDTDMHVMHVWSTEMFKQTHAFIETELAIRQYDLFLLTYPDLPWVADGMREHPDLGMRERFFQIYKKLLQQNNTPWVEIRGIDETRKQNAIAAILSLDLK